MSRSLRNMVPQPDFLAGVGMFLETETTERYHVVFDLSYQPRRLHYSYEREVIDLEEKTTSFSAEDQLEEHQKLQYMCLGVGLKLLTAEFIPNNQFYLMIKPTFALNIHQTAASQDIDAIDAFLVKNVTWCDVVMHFTLGTEIVLAPQTSLVLGGFYERGLIDMVAGTQNLPEMTDLSLKNSRIGLSLGIKL